MGSWGYENIIGHKPNAWKNNDGIYIYIYIYIDNYLNAGALTI
jgi:hypothetical protein